MSERTSLSLPLFRSLWHYLIPFLLFIVSAFIGPTLGGFLYEKIGFEWAAAVQGLWALTSVSNQSFVFIFLTFIEKRDGEFTLTGTFNCVKGISDGLVLSIGVLKETKKVWSTLDFFFSPFKSQLWE